MDAYILERGCFFSFFARLSILTFFTSSGTLMPENLTYMIRVLRLLAFLVCALQITPVSAQALPGCVYQVEEEGTQVSLDKDARIKMIQRYLKSGWSQDSLSGAEKSSNQLFATSFYLPRCLASLIPTAFQCPPPSASRYANIVVYEGHVEAPESGWFRFVGTGDDMLMINFDGKTVLAAGYKVISRGKIINGQDSDYKKNISRSSHATALVMVPGAQTWNLDLGGLTAGLPFQVEKGKVYSVKILYVDMGGGAGFGVFVEHLKDKQSAAKGRIVLPKGQKLDVFRVSNYLPKEHNTRLLIGRNICGGKFEWIPFNEDSLIWKAVKGDSARAQDDAADAGDAEKPKKKKKCKKRGNHFRPLR